MAGVRVVCLEDGYKLVYGGEESEESSYGEPAELELANGETLIALYDTPEGASESEELESRLTHQVYRGRPVPDEDIEVVDGEEDEDGGGDGDDEAVVDE